MAEKKEVKLEKKEIAKKTLKHDSHASDQKTSVPGVQLGKNPKFGKSDFHV